MHHNAPECSRLVFTVSEECFYNCCVGSSRVRSEHEDAEQRRCGARCLRAVEQRDRDGLFAAYHDDVEFVEAQSLPYGGNFRGKDVLRQQLEATPETTWLGTWVPLQPTPAERRMDPRIIATVGDEVTVRVHPAAP